MFKRIKRAIKAFNSDSKPILVVGKSAMPFEQVKKLKEYVSEDYTVILADNVQDFKVLGNPGEIEGDGKAEFLGEGTLEEFQNQEKKDKGLFGLFGTKKDG